MSTRINDSYVEATIGFDQSVRCTRPNDQIIDFNMVYDYFIFASCHSFGQRRYRYCELRAAVLRSTKFISILFRFAVPVLEVNGIVGESVRLPCDTSVSEERITQQEDNVVLILWYREDLGIPIYR